MKVINYILADYLNNFEFIYSISYVAIGISVLVAGLTIFLSCISSARKASKVTPIDLIRNSDDIKIKSNKIKCPRIISKLFNVGGEIAYKNLKRSKKKYRATIVSLVISIVTFIAISSFIEYGFKMSNVYYQELGYNFMIYCYNEEDNSIVYNTYKDIAKFDSVDEYAIHRSVNMKIDYKKYYSDFGYRVNGLENVEDTEEVDTYITILSVGEDEYKRFISEIGENYEECKNGAILIDDYIHYGDIKKEEGEVYNLKAGDTIEGTVDNKKQSLRIVAKTDKTPMGLEEINSCYGYLIVNDEYIEKLRDTVETALMYINSNDTEKLGEEIDEYKKTAGEELEELSFSNYDEYVESNNAFILVISIFLYGFITVITVIGITNIFNTITTNMNLRSKEFANLKSIGMTKKEFNRMIRLESIFYGMKSLIIRYTNRISIILFNI